MQAFSQDTVRPRAASSSVIRDVAAWLVLAAVASSTCAAQDAGATPEPAAAQSFIDWIVASYEQAPALVLGLVALLAVPPLALIGLYASRREADATAVSELKTQVRRRTGGRPAATPREGVRTGHIPLRPLEAWVEVVNASEVAPALGQSKFNLGRTLLRIGREADNDICLTDTTVHRYHAAIHRTEDAEYVITDLSSASGNGVLVNGRPVAEARLGNGDVIELGRARIAFMAKPA
jgi:hypothetical protein